MWVSLCSRPHLPHYLHVCAWGLCVHCPQPSCRVPTPLLFSRLSAEFCEPGTPIDLSCFRDAHC